LKKRPLYMGHVFSYALRLNKMLPEWVVSSIQDVPAIHTDWPLKYHPGSFELCPQPWRDIFQHRVSKFIEPMTNVELRELESWNQAELE